MGRTTGVRGAASRSYTYTILPGASRLKPREELYRESREIRGRYTAICVPFIRLHEKFRTHIPRCFAFLSFATAGSLSSSTDRLYSNAIDRARSSIYDFVSGCDSICMYATRTLVYIHIDIRCNSALALLNEIRDPEELV